MKILFLFLINLLCVKVQRLPYGDDYNGTHVMVDNRYFLVVDCNYENNSDIDRSQALIPQLNYTDTIVKQSLFVKLDSKSFQRLTCYNTKAECDCVDNPKLSIGYYCNCPYRTSFFLKYFNEHTKHFEGRCEMFSTLCGKCNQYHTVKCIILDSTSVRCQCMRGYESTSNCNSKYDACSIAPEGSSLSGNEACRIRENNKCLASVGFQVYNCQCFFPNKEDYNLGFPNCMGEKVRKCDSVLCINGGVCDPRVGKYCKCPNGYSGKYCEVIHYKYIGSWVSWTSCYPECGNYGLRSSDAVCDGPRTIFCSGVIRKWQRCSAMSCRLRFLASVQNKTIRGLRLHLAQMTSLTKEESITLLYIFSLGGVATGLVYIFITELFG